MPKKELNGSDVADFIKERQRSVVRGMDRPPKLVIISTNPNPVTDLYLRIKQRYAEDIGAEVEVVECASSRAGEIIAELNADELVDGIVVQLPLDVPERSEEVLSQVSSSKDVDGLGRDSIFDPATPTAILWLLSAYNVSYESKQVLVIGQGRLVGAPLIRMLRDSGCNPLVADESTDKLTELTEKAEVIITAAGVPRLITADMVPANVVIVDAGAATDNGEVVGDVADDLRARADIVITPKRGGVGPLTIAALFENLLRASKE